MVAQLIILSLFLNTTQIYIVKPKKETQFREDKFIINMGIKLYQNTISKQQGEVCVFEPSCSHFAQQAVSKYGLKGVLMAIDRLERCNGTAWRYANRYYPVVETRNRGYKLNDLPEWYE
ncbi:membrane protein insertion efficiency factor YidD [candidate division WOR-3 bacterium]|nr:membrane protein insertion efficiency factor YidD [candidate division WOR-3 bacterium]